MDRRQFLSALIAVGLVPASTRETNPKLADLEAELRDHFGDKAKPILETAHACVQRTIEQHPDDDLDSLTEIALRDLVRSLKAKGISV